MIRHKISVETSPVPTQELTQRRCCRRMLTRRSCHGAQMSTHSLNVNMNHQLLFSCCDCFRWKMGSWCIEFREKWAFPFCPSALFDFGGHLFSQRNESPVRGSFYNYECLFVCWLLLSPASLYTRITNEKRKFFLNDKNRAHTFIMFLFCGVPGNSSRSARNNQHRYNAHLLLFEHTSCVCKHRDLCSFRELKKLNNFPCSL